MATAKRQTKSTRQSGSASSKTSPQKKSALPDADTLFGYYRDMLLLRRFEEKAGQLYGMGLIGGFCHLYIGQEAVAVGIQSKLTDKDSVITGYRDHGHMLAAGMEPSGVMAELTGRATGYSKGKGGSMHMFAKDRRFYGGHGIVGAPAPLGTGIAFAHQYTGDGGVCICYFGDGAANQGQVYESFNMAALWGLPIVYVIENNRYGMGTSVARASAGGEHLYQRGSPYGIPGEQIDGMDVLAVGEAAEKAIGHAREEGPMILEAMTYRYRGHSMSDPAKYRSREEVQEMREQRDPIENLRKLLVDRNLADENRLKEIDKEIRGIVNDAAKFAQDSPEPDPSELWTDILLEA